MNDRDAYTRHKVPGGQHVLSGPSQCEAAPRMAVRGDLAHIALAGKCFVPHYAVPVSYTVGAEGGALMPSAAREGEPLAMLPAGTRIDVLDIAGDWAWGQCEGADEPWQGLVGYIVLTSLELPGQ